MTDHFRTKEELSAGLARVIELRRRLALDPDLGEKWLEVKHFQSQLARRIYGDLLRSLRYRAAGEFFLDELYGARDFEQRDSEILRVVPKLARMLPERAIHTLALAVELDELSEQLDVGMAGVVEPPITEAEYAFAFRQVGTREQRERQIDLIDEIGRSLDKLARIPFIAPLLHMMRGPAEAAGLGHLQHFLQHGFDAFKGMNGALEFLATIHARQSHMVATLWNGGTLGEAISSPMRG
jgi:hypothetical protein